MKRTWYLSPILFLIAIIIIYIDWNVDGFDFFKFQEQHLYFQSWISVAGILFSTTLAITTFIIYKKMKLHPLKYISLGFLVTSISYLIIGYHASYCKICSDLGYCAASHNYSDYLMIIAFVIFIFLVIITNRNLDILKKMHSLRRFSYGLVIATILLTTTLFISLKYLEIPDNISYLYTINLQAFVFILPIIIIIWAFIYFRQIYKVSKMYLFIAILSSFSFLPQFLHILTCNDCHTMECSEFYVFSGLLMLIVTGLFIHAVNIQLQELKKKHEK